MKRTHCMMPRNILLLCGVSLMLISCGAGYNSNVNGGSGNGSGSGSGSAGGGSQVNSNGVEGVYSGMASSGYTFWTIILPNNQLYGIYATANGNQLLLDGMIVGQGTMNSSGYTASVTDFPYTGSAKSGTFSASDFTGASLDGTLTEGATVTTFYAPSMMGSIWDYGTTFTTPASLSSISGTWTGTLLDGMTTTVTISSAGGVTGSSSGCSFTGTAVPDNSRTNFYDVSLTFGGNPCAFPNQTANGIAVEYLLSDNVTNQFLVAVTVGNSAGTVFAAERQ
jgi:hypothetical protein